MDLNERKLLEWLSESAAKPAAQRESPAYVRSEMPNEEQDAAHDLRILHRHGLVTTQRQGQHICYSLTPDFLRQSRGKRHLNLGCCRLEMPEKMP